MGRLELGIWWKGVDVRVSTDSSNGSSSMGRREFLRLNEWVLQVSITIVIPILR
jgi:hypothetical protein